MKTPFWLLLSACLLAAVPASVTEPVTAASPRSPEAPAAGEDWQARARAAIERDEYNASPADQGLQAPNRAQNLRTWFRRDGVEVAPRIGKRSAWSWSWRTEAWGRAGTMRPANAVAPVALGSRVEYRRAGMVEWYENLPAGVEQGFTLATRPKGAGRLRIEGKISDELRAVPGTDEDALSFVDRSGTLVLRYANLVAWDARGTKLNARLEAGAGSLAIEVEDEDASYPITIDPLMTNAAWTAEGGQAGANFGWSVAAAGDVNGDGYSDVVIGAYQYDVAVGNEGRAFVYCGSDRGLATSPAWTADGDQASAYFGSSVATAGDINGDGYSDVIVGASLYDNGETDEGRVYVYLGSASGLAASPAWTAESDRVGANFGGSVATAGDVNGDGYSDIVIGAHHYDDGEESEGRAVVYMGSASGLAASPAWTAYGNQTWAYFGISVATAGDVNGDGYADVIIGSNQYRTGQSAEGRAFVYHGSAAGLSLTAAWTAESNQVGAYFGGSVATAGDVNGDGYADVIVGAPGFDNGQNEEGRAFVYHGSATGLGASPAWTAEGNQGAAYFGCAVGTAGDTNGDGYSDVIVGAWAFDTVLSNEGKAFAYHGSASGLSAAPAWTMSGKQASAFDGHSVAAAGDVNHDGYDDVIVGGYAYDHGEGDEGRASVFHGSIAGVGVNPAWTVDSNQPHAHLGYAVAAAGDVNGDGFGDVIVGAPFFDSSRTDEGRALVYYGSATGLRPAAAWNVVSGQDSAMFGCSVASAGDVNHDGYDDVIVGAYLYDNGEANEGKACVYLGSAAGLASTPAWTCEGNQQEARMGYSVAAAGDVNGDGYSDVIVGAYRYDGGQSDEGRAYVYLGKATGLASTPIWTGESNQTGAYFGAAVAAAGDVNADGYDDIIVGAYRYDMGENNEGRAFVYHGSASGPAPTPAWTAESDQAEALFGWSVAKAGDVNGDGYSDVIVGAYAYDNGQTDEGRAFVYRGSAQGLGASPAWTAEGDQAGAGFGYLVSTAGDVNDDGYWDVLVGAHLYDGGQTDEGRAFLYRGFAHGPAASPAWFAEGNQSSASFGWALATAGDINGDGFADVIVGAHRYDMGQSNEGRAFAYQHLRTGVATTGVFDVDAASAGLRLQSIRPNPSRSQSVVQYVLPRAGAARLTIHDLLGRRVVVLADGPAEAGAHSVTWEGRDARGAAVPGGVYWARLESGGEQVARKLVRR